jgi:hypothetical protein
VVNPDPNGLKVKIDETDPNRVLKTKRQHIVVVTAAEKDPSTPIDADLTFRNSNGVKR